MSDSQSASLNGVDVGKLLATLDAIKADPSLANFQFHAETEWQGGGHSRTTIQNFFGAGSEDASRSTPFVVVSDSKWGE